jgi:hypothetical protein
MAHFASSSSASEYYIMHWDTPHPCDLFTPRADRDVAPEVAYCSDHLLSLLWIVILMKGSRRCPNRKPKHAITSKATLFQPLISAS